MGAAAHLVGVFILKLMVVDSLALHLPDVCSWYFLQAVCSLKNSELSNVNKINIRLYNYSEKTIALKELKAAYISNISSIYPFISHVCVVYNWSTDMWIYLAEKMVAVCGTVLKVNTVKPLVVQLNFRCMKCGTEITRVFCDGKFSPPVSCNISGCKSRTFTPERSTAKLIDFQKIRYAM